MKVDIFDTPNKYKIIYADPPWSYDDKLQNKAKMGAATAHYKTMPLGEIWRLPVRNLADKNCVLFLWATYPKIRESLQTIEAWGFKYKTIAFQWVKTNRSLKHDKLFLHRKDFFFGLGRWTRGNTEPCLLATKGRPARVDNAVSQLIFAPLTKHSEKPAEVRGRIKRLMGEGASIELFARKAVAGWDCWGDEV